MFGEFRTGLDGLAVELWSAADLDAWRRTLESSGCPTQAPATRAVSFRDADKIQLVFLPPIASLATAASAELDRPFVHGSYAREPITSLSGPISRP
jgi:hypothetical protein